MLKKILNEQILVLDGAMGTELLKRGLKTGDIPELLNLSHPEIITDIHRSYIKSGSKVVYANTFGANRAKFDTDGSVNLKQVIISALKCAREAAGQDNFVALDIGPTGELLEPMGSLSLEEAYSIFKEVVDIGKDYADLIVIETMTSLGEVKAALLAAKENCELPIIATMSFEENMRTFTGCTPSAFALTASPFADAIGINCSLGPDKILPIMQELSRWTNLPLVVKANAGMPDENGNYNVNAQEFSQVYKQFLELGVSVIGGCCGTTPNHIKSVAELAKLYSFKKQTKVIPSAVCSENSTVVIDGVRIIGERINPTGKKLMKKALLENNFDYIKEQAVEQSEIADILDVNVGLPEIDECETMRRAVKQVQSVSDCPLQIDSNDPKTIEQGLRSCVGKAIVNSVNGETQVLEKILPIVKKYGAAVVGLTIDENGLAKDANERVRIAEKILSYARKYKIDDKDVFIDCLTLTVSAEQPQASQTLEALRLIKSKLKLKTVLGVSNISFGLPERQNINTAFLIAALNSGLDMPILNPNIKANADAVRAYKVISAEDINAKNYIAALTGSGPEETQTDDIMYSVISGLSRTKEITAQLLKTIPPLNVISDYLMPALDKTGELFEKGQIFLPQLIAAAESAKLGFDEVKKSFSNENAASKGKIILATVKGDIHDIGKNIVKILLQNYGYDVIDLGKNVDKELIIETAVNGNIQLVGLSALMTTTAQNMKDTVAALKKVKPDCKIMVGGAVITADFAQSIGADFYAKDANESVKYAKQVFGS